MNASTPVTPSAYPKKIVSYANAVAGEDYKACGKYWAAVSGTRVVSMTLIPSIDDKAIFDLFREKARDALAVVGELATGEMQIRDGKKVFVKRMSRNHQIKGAAGQREEPVFTIPFHLQ